MKVLYDTDIGSDIDDAICLAYLLAQPACELLGVTTVTGESEQRAKMASALCMVADRQVPIYPGAEQPLLIPQQQPVASQASRLVNWRHEPAFPHGEAIEFLRQTIRAHPGEVTLLATGPLTNIALLFRIDPEIPALLERFVAMSGAFLGGAQPAEWNVQCDPHAAAIVYAARVATHRSIGLDVTTRVVMSKADVPARFGAPLLRPVLDFATVWFERASTITFHDPLAAVTLFDDDVCSFARGAVSVELDDGERQGVTRWESGDHASPHQVAVAVQPERFFEHFFEAFSEREAPPRS